MKTLDYNDDAEANAKKEKPSNNKGPRSEETRQKMSAAHKGHNLGMTYRRTAVLKNV